MLRDSSKQFFPSQLCTAFNCILYGHYLPTVILIIIAIPSPTHFFTTGLKPSFSANPSHCSFPFLLQDSLHGFPRLFTVTSEDIPSFSF